MQLCRFALLEDLGLPLEIILKITPKALAYILVLLILDYNF